MPKLNIMHIIGGGEFGGAEDHVLTLLKELDKEKFNVKLCCLFPEPLLPAALQQEIDAFYLRMKNKLDGGIVFRLAQLLRNGKTDILHTHGVRANLVGRLAARLAGCKVVTTVHSILKHDYPGRWARFVNGLPEGAFKGGTSHFIAVSQAIKESLIQQGINKDKITVIHNGIDLNKFSPGHSDMVRDIIGCGHEDKIIGVIARLHPVKGHKYFLEAAVRLLSEYKNLRFVLVGDGKHKDELSHMIDALGIGNNTFLLGFQKDIANIMRSLDILVVPSLSEGFGLTAVEAMAVGVPVVASAVGGLLDIVADGETGVLVPPADSKALARGIALLLDNGSRSEDMIKKAYQRVVANFSKQGMARKTEQIYLNLSHNKLLR